MLTGESLQCRCEVGKDYALFCQMKKHEQKRLSSYQNPCHLLSKQFLKNIFLCRKLEVTDISPSFPLLLWEMVIGLEATSLASFRALTGLQSEQTASRNNLFYMMTHLARGRLVNGNFCLSVLVNKYVLNFFLQFALQHQQKYEQRSPRLISSM